MVKLFMLRMKGLIKRTRPGIRKDPRPIQITGFLPPVPVVRQVVL